MQSVVAAKLEQTVRANELGAFYSPAQISALAQKVASKVDFHALAAR
jgi:hypothetical protein